jgi:phage recombination protein Bet
MSNIVVAQANKLADSLGLTGTGDELVTTLKSTAFKGQVSDSQLAALLIVSNQYGLNPWTKEIYAFPDRNAGIVPVVSVDGWARIINQHPQFDGMEFRQDDESCTCIMYRKDRSHPTTVTEYMSECKRNAQPWQSHPKRMLRHKALIQCARLAFGFAGIYDADEADRIAESVNQQMVKEIDALGNEQIAQETEEMRIPADDAASKGVQAYQAFWKELTPAQRKAYGTEAHNRRKAIAMQADKDRTIEAEPVEASPETKQFFSDMDKTVSDFFGE